jgi:hypothetical protein
LAVLLVAMTMLGAAQSESLLELEPGERWVVSTPPGKAEATAVILGVGSEMDSEVVYVVAVSTTFASPNRSGTAILAISEEALRSSVTRRISVSEDLSRWRDVLERVKSSILTGEEAVLRKPLQSCEWPAFDLKGENPEGDI